MDLHEQRQLDMARQMAKVKARTRPWRAIIALVLAVAIGILASTADRDFEWWTGHGHVGSTRACSGSSSGGNSTSPTMPPISFFSLPSRSECMRRIW